MAPPVPVQPCGLVVVAPGAIDVEALDAATVFTPADAQAVAAWVHDQAVSAAEARHALAAEVDTCLAALSDARDARDRATNAQTQALLDFDLFSERLRVVNDASGALATAKAEEARATTLLEDCNHRAAAMAGHRSALADAMRETRTRIELADEARRAQDAPVVAESAALQAGLEAARRMQRSAETAHAACEIVTEELGARHTEAAAHAERLRAVMGQLQEELNDSDSDAEASVRTALAAYEAGSGEASDPQAIALADRWAELQCELAELDRTDPPPPTPRQLDAARARVSRAQAALGAAADSGRSGTITPAEREAIERAHNELTHSHRALGRAARQRHRDAEEELHKLLSVHGLNSWVEYLTAGLGADNGQRRVVAQVEAELDEARRNLAALEAAGEPSQQRLALLDTIENSKGEITRLLGFWPTGGPEPQLRAQPVVGPAQSSALFLALVQAGAPTTGRPIAAAARSWLEEVACSRRSRSEIVSELAAAAGQLDALAQTYLAPEFDKVTQGVAQAATVAALRADQYTRVGDLLEASLGLLQAEQVNGEGFAALVARQDAASWALSTLEHDAQEAQQSAADRAEAAAAATRDAEKALADAWQRLQSSSSVAIPDLPSAVQHLESLLVESAATSDAVIEADRRCHDAEARRAASEAVLRAHDAKTAGFVIAPHEEDIAAHIGSVLGLDGHTPIVLDEPFPRIIPQMFARVLGRLADLATERLVVYVTEHASVPVALRPSPQPASQTTTDHDHEKRTAVNSDHTASISGALA